MKKKVFIHTLYFAAIGIVFGGVIAIASNVGTLNTFVAGETAVADDVNANFTAVETSVNDNDSRIVALEAALANVGTCPSGMVKVGSVCVDIYEASVWDAPDDTATTQYGASSDDYPCGDNGNDCSKADNLGEANANAIYAQSVALETPARYITWFQAQQACANSGKRLITNAEWQMAAAGTPDPGTDDGSTDCAVSSSLSDAGSRSSCVSNWGTYDMVGNLWEWTADWMQDSSDSDLNTYSAYGGDGIYGVDEAFPEADAMPAALIRGGSWSFGASAGVFALIALYGPSGSDYDFGFRCAQ